MRIRFFALLVALLTGWVTSLSGQVYTPEQVPQVFARDSMQLVSDPAGYLTASDRHALNRQLTQLRLSRGVDFAVVLVPSIGEASIEDFSTTLLRSWGLGSKEGNEGLLLLLAIEQRQMRFETGYGLEGVLPDVLLYRLQRDAMRPAMRAGDYAGAISSAIAGVEKALAQEDFRGQVRSARERPNFQIRWEYILFFYLLIVLASGYSAWTSLADYEQRGARSPQWLRARLPQLAREVSRYTLILGVLCLPLGLLYYQQARRRQERLAHLARRCARCEQEALELLPTEEGWRYLPQLARLEMQLGSRHYQVYRCGSCAATELVTEDIGTHWQTCPQCGGRTTEAVSQHPITLPGRGRYIRTTLRCRNCGSEHHADRRDTSGEDLTAMALLLAGLNGAGRHRGGGGFGGGGFSGGSFGGGSSGGGGSTSSW